MKGRQQFPKLCISPKIIKDIQKSKDAFANFWRVSMLEKSVGFGFGKFGLGKERIQITRTVLVMRSQILDLVPIGTKALKWSHISPNSARPKFHPCGKMSNISLINSTVNNNKKHEIFNLIVFVIVCFLSQRKCPYLNAFAECLPLNNVI